MKRLHPFDDTAAVTLFSAVTALANPPAAYGMVPAYWNAGREVGMVPEFDLELWGGGAVTLTNAYLLGGVLHAGTIADDVAASATDVDATANTFTLTAHGLATGDGPVRLTTSNALPGGLALATDYWIIRVDANTVKFALSLADAIAGTAVDITSTGTGNQTVSDTAETKIVAWHNLGLLTGSVALDVRKGRTFRVEHSENVIAYSVEGTLSGAVAVYGRAHPVAER